MWGQPMWLRFSGAGLERLRSLDAEVSVGGTTGWVPLATLGRGEAETAFLAVATNTPSCAVSMYWPETRRWVPVAASLDGLLASLGQTSKTAKEPVVGDDRARLQLEAVKEAERLLDARSSKARTAALEAVLGRLNALSTSLTDTIAGDDGRFGRLGSSLVYRKALVERALGKKREACDTLQFLEVDGAPTKNHDTLFELLLELGEHQRLLAVARGLDPDERARRGLLYAVALLLTGSAADAEPLLVDLVRRWANAGVKLSLGKKKLADELTKSLEALKEQLEERVTDDAVSKTLPALLARVAASTR